MVKESVQNEPLEALAKRITQCANEADEKIIEAAVLLREARARVESGEVGNTKWYVWASRNIGLKESRLRDLLRIAEAKDPRQELERQRALIRGRVEKHRSRAKAKQAVPLATDKDQTGKTPEASKSLSETGAEPGHSHPEDLMGPPPLRNGGEGTGVEEASDGQEQRNRLADWARMAPIEQVREVLTLVKRLEQRRPGSNPVRITTPKVVSVF